MPKIQVIKRKSGTEAYLIYIPVAQAQLAEIKKGDEMLVETLEKGVIEIRKQ
jgi:hypothetical protein